MKNRVCILMLENIRSVENTASIFRTADGFGVSRIILVGTTPAPVDRFGGKRRDFAKVSLGAEESVDWEYWPEALPKIEELKSGGFQIISLEQDSRSRRLKDFRADDRFVLIAGNEVGGISEPVLNSSDAIVEIPMQGSKESLNVSVATGAALFVLLYNHA